jgi:hypothetical protein
MVLKCEELAIKTSRETFVMAVLTNGVCGHDYAVILNQVDHQLLFLDL